MLTILKLRNGQEVIGSVTQQHDEHITVQDPLVINYRFVAGQPMPTISLSRYMPFSLAPSFEFFMEDIMHAVPPSDAFAAYYDNSIQYCREIVDKSVDDELSSAAQIPRSGKGDLMEIYQAILERTQVKGPLN